MKAGDRSELCKFSANEAFVSTMSEEVSNRSSIFGGGLHQVMKRKIVDVSTDSQLNSNERKHKKIELVGTVVEGLALDGEHTTKATMDEFLEDFDDNNGNKVDDLGMINKKNKKKVLLLVTIIICVVNHIFIASAFYDL